MSQTFDTIQFSNVTSQRHGWGLLLTTLRPSDFGPRSFGPKCKCHGERNMVRIESMQYCCQKTGQVFQLKELLWP